MTNLNSIKHNINKRDIDKIINTNDINFKFKYLYTMYEKINNKYIKKEIDSEDENSYNLINYSLIHELTLKNQVNKIINAYRNYKKKIMTQYINEYNIRNVESEGIKYLGYLNSLGKKQGFGIQKMKDGSRFYGIFTNDKANGWGIYEHKDGDIYKGEYQNDKTYGYGEYSHKNGAIYYGYWINDIQFGIGYERWNDSSQYSGEYSGEYNNGKKDGIGTYIWEDGTMYKGEWELNNIQGFGIYNYTDGRQYSGEWMNNQMNGYGEFIWADGKKFFGFYKNDKKNGFGIYYWPDNRFFVGFWKDGKQNGVGKYIKGESFKYGIWKDGKREKWLDDNESYDCLSHIEEEYTNCFEWSKNELYKYMELIDDNNEVDNDEENKYISGS